MTIQQMLLKVYNTARVFVGSASQSANAISPNNATAYLRFNTTGDVEGRTQAVSGIFKYTWRLSGINADYDVRATMISGVLTTGNIGTWDNLVTFQEWSLLRSAVGSTSASFTVEVRDAVTLVVLGTGTFTLTATKT